MYSELDLKRRIAGFPEALPLSTAFERRARVGVGYQGKWYRSQREHWLGWITVKERKDGLDLASSPASRRWGGLASPPMLIWLAEAAGLPAERVQAAAEAALAVIGDTGKESAAAAKAVRNVLPWLEVEAALTAQPTPDAEQARRAYAEAAAAWERLVARNPRYR